MSDKYNITEESLKNFHEKCGGIFAQIARDIVGQKEVIEFSVVAMIAGGNVLLEGVPGIGKTRLVRSLGRVFNLPFSRIQFTPDLMPADVTGTNIIVKDERGSSVFQFQPGPVFSNIILADEINRATPKTQSALLEAMQERIVTVAGKPYPVPDPFFVLATQNPIEQEGTYPLPEAQLDRFMFNIMLDYPTFEQELSIIKQTTNDQVHTLKKVMTATEIEAFQSLVRALPVPDNVLQEAVKIVSGSRPNTPQAKAVATQYLLWGAGPRASQNLIIGAKCHAALNGKFSPDIEDVHAVALQVLRHRLVKNYKAEAEGISTDDIIRKLL